MRLIMYLFLLGSGLLAACNGAPVSSTRDIDTLDTSTFSYSADTSSRDTLPTFPKPEGFYQVKLPCADCKGIEHTVLFNPDFTYRLEEVRLEENSRDTIVFTGTWKPTDTVIWLYRGPVVKARYTWQGDILQYLDYQTRKKSAMQKLTSAQDNEVWRNKKEAGIEFFGVGNEPFWNIEIDEQKAIAFHLADWSQPVLFKPTKPIALPDSLVYQTANDSARLSVVIYNRFCSDGMSDNIYPQKLKVMYNGQTYNGCGIQY